MMKRNVFSIKTGLVLLRSLARLGPNAKQIGRLIPISSELTAGADHLNEPIRENVKTIRMS